MARDEDHRLEQWITAWGDALFRFALAYTHHPEEAQDVAQETFWRLYLSLRRHPQRPITPGWLFTTARHLVVDGWRRRRHETDWFEQPSKDTTAEAEWINRLSVAEVLDRLSPTDRECLIYFYFAQWPVAKIAHALGVSEETVRTRLVRARRHFRKNWEEHNEGPSF